MWRRIDLCVYPNFWMLLRRLATKTGCGPSWRYRQASCAYAKSLNCSNWPIRLFRNTCPYLNKRASLNQVKKADGSITVCQILERRQFCAAKLCPGFVAQFQQTGKFSKISVNLGTFLNLTLKSYARHKGNGEPNDMVRENFANFYG